MSRFWVPSALVLILAVSAHAVEPPKVTVTNLQVQRYDSIVAPWEEGVKEARLFNQLPAPEGSIYLAIQAHVDIEWVEGGRTYLSLTQKETVLLDGDKPIQWVGTYPNWCQVFKNASLDFAQNSLDRTFAAIYLVPKDRSAFKLVLAGQQVEIPVPKTTMTMDAAKVISAKIKKVALVASVPDSSADAAVTNPKGKLLVVTVEYETKMAEVKPAFEPWFFFHQWVSLKLDKQTIANMGELNRDGKLTGRSRANNSNNMQTGGVKGSTLKETITFVFPVPADVKDFELTILGAAVAKGTVGK